MGYWDKKAAREPKTEAEGTSVQEDSLEAMEAETLQELGEVERGFRDRMKAENKRFRDMCDTEYWFCVCFTSRAQREEFMKKIGLDPSDKYIDGKDMAQAYRKAMKEPDMEFAKVQPFGKEYSAIARDP